MRRSAIVGARGSRRGQGNRRGQAPISHFGSSVTDPFGEPTNGGERAVIPRGLTELGAQASGRFLVARDWPSIIPRSVVTVRQFRPVLVVASWESK